MTNIHNPGFWFNLALLTIGLSVMAVAFKYGIFANSRPGPGLFPFLAGGLMTISSLAGFRPRAANEVEPAEADIKGIVLAMRIAGFVTTLVLAVVLAHPIGLLLSVLLMMLLVGIVCSDTGFELCFVMRLGFVSVLFVLACHVFFKLLLNVPVLEGPLDRFF